MTNDNNSGTDKGRYPRWLGYAIAVILGLAFIAILFSITWNTALEDKQNQFTFDTAPLKENISHNVLVSNYIIDSIVAYMDSQPDFTGDKFNSFSQKLLEIYPFVTAIVYFPVVGPDEVDDFRQRLDNMTGEGESVFTLTTDTDNGQAFHLPVLYQVARGKPLFKPGYDIRADKRYNLIIKSLIHAGSSTPIASTIPVGDGEEYGLFQLIAEENTTSLLPGKHPESVHGVILVVCDPAGFLGNVTVPSDVTLSFYNEFASLGRQLLYRQEGELSATNEWLISSLAETHQVQLPSHAVKLNISRNIYWDDIEKGLIYIALFIGFAVTLLLIALVRAKEQQASELRRRNIVIERTVRAQTKELAIARDKAVEGSHMKSEFLASMSHEIRTPLNAIIGMSELLSETPLTEEQEKYIGVFRRAGDTLLSLVNDILDLSKIEAQQLKLENIPFNITDVVEESVEIYALKAAEKKIELISHIDTTLDTQRKGDPSRLRQIILNLISNALKFIETGEIVVSVTPAEDPDPDRVKVSVRDTGIGIPQDKLTAIFENFTQADSSTTRKYGGTGLGLSICKSLVGLMQGRIWVESSVGEGSVFAFVIKLPVVAGVGTGLETISSQLVGRQVLTAVSNQTNRRVMEELLTHYGVTVKSVGRAAELLEVIPASPGSAAGHDLVVIDFELPDMNSFQLVEEVKQRDPQARIVMIINADDLTDNMARIKAAGIDFYLVKPVKQSELLNLVANLSLTKEQRPSSDTREADVESATQQKKILLVDDNSDNRLLIKTYLKKSPYQVDEAENGQTAIELFRDRHHDLILMDVQMPVMDGHEASRQIRSWETEQGHSATPIIALTAHATREEVDKSVAAGCDSHLSKPVKKAMLLETLENYLGC